MATRSSATLGCQALIVDMATPKQKYRGLERSLVYMVHEKINMRTNISRRFLILLIAFLIVDVSLIVLRLNYYYFVIVDWSIPLLMHTILFAFLFIVLKKQFLWVPFVGTILLFFLWSITYITSLIFEWNSISLHSPKGTETLTIKYRTAVLGESNHFYEFYQKGLFGTLLMRKIGDGDFFRIVVFDRKETPDAIKALGAGDPRWVDEKTVIFHTKDGQKQIHLK
ncbi:MULTISPECIES: hypothetical protein [Paenibacillus]|uniref:hypothetical protein n=1 Tax=Paenibacillus TaxID=44249 RepID=UPI0022B8E71F|nr:hypothetical protein [Paenibacillus caseinilyticus]MCZ8522485.1 hypothetical protein [Paenibacillus caseinilyticus]